MDVSKLRNPVPAAPMKRPLACVDLDPTNPRYGQCAAKREAAKVGVPFVCPNRGYGEGECLTGTFLYPRKKKTWMFKFHQGLDLTPEPRRTGTTPEPIVGADGRVDGVPRASILSVSAGKVWSVDPDPSGAYGKVIVIKDESDYYFLYAHCHQILVGEREEVREGQPIAIVGRTGINNPKTPDHLHFEVARGPLPTKPKSEYFTKLGEGPGYRLNPFEVLAELGPWTADTLYLPDGQKVDPDVIEKSHLDVEYSTTGGYFPLGANNMWHGGVHLPVVADSDLKAPFSGEIVALRLDPDPATAMGAFGHTNFILMRHTIAESVFAQMQDGEATKPKPGSVGADAKNDPEQVREVKRRLHAHQDADGKPYYDPAEPAQIEDGDVVDQELIDAIVAFQTDIAGRTWEPDGKVQIPGATWAALQRLTADETGETKRHVYCLLMHVGAAQIDDALAKRVPWLTRTKPKQEPQNDPSTQQDDEGGDTDAKQEQVDDSGDARSTLDEDFLASVTERGADESTRVLSGLSIPIESGETLWVSGQVVGLTDTDVLEPLDRVHWEIFSEHPLFSVWDVLDDPDDDLTVDAPKRLMDLVEAYTGIPGFERDGILTVTELHAFYADERSRGLRRTQARFRSEWAIDHDKALADLEAKGWQTKGLREKIDRYQWWDAAADVVPPTRHIWHYNPIEFVSAYQELIGAPGSRALPPPVPTPPEGTTATLVVRVFNASGGRLERAVVMLSDDDGRVEASATTSERDRRDAGGGEAVFRQAAVGPHLVRVEGVPMTPVPAPVLPYQFNLVEIHTEVPGDPPPLGQLRVKVWTHRKGPADDVAVMVLETGEATRTDRAGWATFELPHGEYQIAAGDAEAVKVTLDKPKRTTKVYLPAPRRSVWIVAERADEPAVGVRVVLMNMDKEPVQEQTTDATGVALFPAVPEGRYRAAAESITPVYLHVGPSGATKRLVLPETPPVQPSPPQSPDEGIVLAHLQHEGEPVDGEVVVVLDDADNLVMSLKSVEGAAEFSLDPGSYTVAVQDQKTVVTVTAGEDVALFFDLEDDDPDEPVDPVEEPSPDEDMATLQAIVITPAGPKAGVEVRARRGGVVRTKGRTDKDGNAALEVAPGTYQVFVAGAFSQRAQVTVAAGAFYPVLLMLEE